jgi:hypothetical protein
MPRVAPQGWKVMSCTKRKRVVDFDFTGVRDTTVSVGGICAAGTIWNRSLAAGDSERI